MPPRTIRRIVVAVCICGIAGMIVSSIVSSTGGAITFGLVTAVAVVTLIVLTAAVGAEAYRAEANGGAAPPITDEVAAQRLEQQIGSMVADGADEDRLRDLVRDAIRLGRSAGR
jgi:hypothetical protein